MSAEPMSDLELARRIETLRRLVSAAHRSGNTPHVSEIRRLLTASEDEQNERIAA